MITAKRSVKKDTPLDMTISVDMNLSDRKQLASDIIDAYLSIDSDRQADLEMIERLRTFVHILEDA